MRRLIKFIFLLLLVFVGLQLMNQFLIFSGNKLFDWLRMPNEYEVLTVGIFQQLIQIFLAIFLAKLLINKNSSEIGINARNLKQSFKYFGYFSLCIIVIILAYLFLSYFYFTDLWLEMRNAKLPGVSGIVTKILFQSIFPGLGEELLFRGFLISLFIKSIDLNIEKTGAKIVVSLVSAVFFAMAHIYFQPIPFQITHIDVVQLLLAFFCGLFYSFMFIKTKSLVGPILSHNFSNVTMTITGYIVSIL